MKLRREFNGVSKLRHYLQVVAFTLVVATGQRRGEVLGVAGAHAQQGLVDAGFAAVIQTVQIGRYDFETVHAGLHGADRVDLGDLDDHAFLT